MEVTLSATLLALLPSVVTGCLGWLFGRRQSNANAASTEIANFNAAIEAYKNLYAEREKVYETTIDSLKKQVNDVTEENKELRKQIMTVSNFITAYMIKNATNEQVDLSNILNITKELHGTDD